MLFRGISYVTRESEREVTWNKLFSFSLSLSPCFLCQRTENGSILFKERERERDYSTCRPLSLFTLIPITHSYLLLFFN